MTSKIASEGPELASWDATIDGIVVSVIKLPNDPVCLRASLGGDATVGYYLTFRGDAADIENLLMAGLEALKRKGQA